MLGVYYADPFVGNYIYPRCGFTMLLLSWGNTQIKCYLAKIVSSVKLLEYVDGMISMNTHLKGVLGFRGVFDIEFYLLWRYDILCRMGQDIL